MKGVLLLGGSGSRLTPLNEVCNKHLLNIGGKPMAQHSIEKLVKVGITDILIITGGEHIGSIASYFRGGSKFGCNITYKIQEEAGGIAEALKLVSGYMNEGEKFIVILGDNIFEDNLDNMVDIFAESGSIDTILTYQNVEDPQRFGVLDYHNMCIVEKPDVPPSDSAVLGIYGYTYNTKFRSVLNSLIRSDRGEYEVTDLNNGLISGLSHYILKLEGWWTDAGTHESLQHANNLVYGQK